MQAVIAEVLSTHGTQAKAFGGGGFNRSAHSAGPHLQNEILQMQGLEITLR